MSTKISNYKQQKLPHSNNNNNTNNVQYSNHSCDSHLNDSPNSNGEVSSSPTFEFDTNNNNHGSSSPFSRSPWSAHMFNMPSFSDGDSSFGADKPHNRLMGSLVREEGHIYSLAASGDLLYTGSDSKNIRVWKNQREYSGFKSNSGLVKSIVISRDNYIFTGHQDGKTRVWKMSNKNPTIHKRVGTLPTFKAYLKKSMKPSSYVDIGRNRNAVWIRHFDAISSLSLSEDHKYLYSASWDKTVKVWRTSNFKCLESLSAHDDAVNAVVAGFDGLVFTGSADGTVKVWRREVQGKGTKHFFSQALLKQECAVTALAVDHKATMVYCGSSDGHVNFWGRQDFATSGGMLYGHKLAVLCLAISGRLVFSGSADMNICVWKRVSDANKSVEVGEHHVCLSILTGHNGPVKCLAVEMDADSSLDEGRCILYSGSLDKSVKMWRISDQALPEVAQATVSQSKRVTQNQVQVITL